MESGSIQSEIKYTISRLRMKPEGGGRHRDTQNSKRYKSIFINKKITSKLVHSVNSTSVKLVLIANSLAHQPLSLSRPSPAPKRSFLLKILSKNRSTRTARFITNISTFGAIFKKAITDHEVSGAVLVTTNKTGPSLPLPLQTSIHRNKYILTTLR